MIGSPLRYQDCPIWQKIYLAWFGIPHLSTHIKAMAISAWLPACSPCSVLDAGCGSGLFSFWLAQRMPSSKIIGVDSSEEDIALARQMLGPNRLVNLSFERADLRCLPYVESFDFILCLDVLEHIREDEQALGCLRGALKPGGQMIVHVPRRHQEQFRAFGSWDAWGNHGHARDEYTREEIQSRLLNAGFKIERFRTTFRPAQAPFWEIATKLRQLAPHLSWLFFPLLFVGSRIGGLFESEKGNGFLLLCSKEKAL